MHATVVPFPLNRLIHLPCGIRKYGEYLFLVTFSDASILKISQACNSSMGEDCKLLSLQQMAQLLKYLRRINNYLPMSNIESSNIEIFTTLLLTQLF